MNPEAQDTVPTTSAAPGLDALAVAGAAALVGAEEVGGRYRVVGTDRRSVGSLAVVAAFDTILERTVDLVLFPPVPLSARIAERSRLRALIREDWGTVVLDVVDGTGRTVVVTTARAGDDVAAELIELTGLATTDDPTLATPPPGVSPRADLTDAPTGPAPGVARVVPGPADATATAATPTTPTGATPTTRAPAAATGTTMTGTSEGDGTRRRARGAAGRTDTASITSGRRPGGGSRSSRAPGRSRRWSPGRVVIVAAAAIVGMGVGDLLATLLH